MTRIALLISLSLGALSLAGCATAGVKRPVEPGAGECKGEPGQAFVGRKASADVGRELLEATGAKTLRWVPPRTLVTMDFRPDRLTVSYNDDMVIERVSCG